jgi:hypothetical protein
MSTRKEATMKIPGRRVLVVAHHACPCPTLVDAVEDRAAGGHVHIVAPALNARLRHWVSDIDGALANAQRRLASVMETLRRRGLQVTAEVGDSDPLMAIDDALARFPADEIVLATRAPGDANWLERGLAARARERFPLPVIQLTGDHASRPDGTREHEAGAARQPATT